MGESEVAHAEQRSQVAEPEPRQLPSRPRNAVTCVTVSLSTDTFASSYWQKENIFNFP